MRNAAFLGLQEGRITNKSEMEVKVKVMVSVRIKVVVSE